MRKKIKPLEILSVDIIPEPVDDKDEIVDIKISKFQMNRVNKLITAYTKQQEKQKNKRETIKTDKLIKHSNFINKFVSSFYRCLSEIIFFII